MCGIAGIYYNLGIADAPNIDKKNLRTSDIQKLKRAIERMNQSQGRRGPDDEGVFVDVKNGLAFGHRRLSILDLSKAGKQPMSRGDVWITFNGEIYNFLELKKDLKKKDYKFKTKTDTEVILALYAEYGEQSFGMLRGMFAFGLWDGKNQKLFLVKDRYGIKPLYYYADSEKLVFASTVKAIAESGLISVVKNPDAFIGFLLFGSVPLPLTTLKNVSAVPAGCYLVREADDRQKLVQYYDPLEFFIENNHLVNKSMCHSNDTRNNDLMTIIAEIHTRLKESIKFHLISDAPLGVFLSGGLDSSAIAALAANSREKQITTLSIIFDEKEFSEEYYSDLVAKKINSDHRKIKITKQDFYDSFDEIFKAMDQPTIDGVNTFFIAKAAKQAGLKTVLSGLGADEIFLGYPHFKKAEILRRIQKMPGFLKIPLKLGVMFGDKYSKLDYFTNDDILSFYLGIRGLFIPQETAKILDVNLGEVKNFLREINSRLFNNSVCQSNDILINNLTTSLNPIDLMSYLELEFYLQNQLLKDTDFMSMYHSVEVRVPFLDHPLVEYVSSLPPDVKLNSRLKPLLSAAVHDVLPSEVLSRSKMGFTFPFEKWLKEKGDFKSGHWSRFWAKKVLENFNL